ncbi:MAG: DUF4928 family protein [Gallionellaceae bacterium]|nr:DUF4928 family protein [Gallionellaceae bacterium]
MTKDEIAQKLSAFRDENKINGKGALAVVIHISRYAKENGLPLDADALITEGSGQVLGLGKGAVQRILNDYAITLILAEEGGRTSRGSIGIMRTYVAFLNGLHIKTSVLEEIEAWWIERIREHFSAKPFRLRFDSAKSLQFIIQDLLVQAKKRQQESSGTMYQGAVLQHLVGAKLELAMPKIQISHHGSSVADAVGDRAGDFVIDDSIIHITTSPGEAVIQKCQRNIEAGTKPIILTIADGVSVANGLARNAGLIGRIDIMDAEQFLAANLHELAFFKTSERLTTLEKLVETYNRIVSENETDPSLRIEIG